MLPTHAGSLCRGFVLAFTLVLTVGSPSDARAQIPIDSDGDWTVSILPRVGYLYPGNAGPLEGWEPQGLRIIGGPVAGLAVEVATPLPWVAFRGTFEQAARNQLFFDQQLAVRPLFDAALFNQSNALQAQYSIGGVLRPLPELPIRPTGIVGVGLRHQQWTPGAVPGDFLPFFPESNWDRTWHWGGGIEADATPIAVRVEVLNYRAMIGEPELGEVNASDRFVMIAFSWIGR